MRGGGATAAARRKGVKPEWREWFPERQVPVRILMQRVVYVLAIESVLSNGKDK